MEFLIVLAVLALVVALVSSPLWHNARARSHTERNAAADLAELEAARDAKYREIRDAELDHQTGKLSDADYEAVDKSLRAEAIEILNALDRASAKPPA
jgi:Tfp pilus assembly protein PilE